MRLIFPWLLFHFFRWLNLSNYFLLLSPHLWFILNQKLLRIIFVGFLFITMRLITIQLINCISHLFCYRHLLLGIICKIRYCCYWLFFFRIKRKKDISFTRFFRKLHCVIILLLLLLLCFILLHTNFFCSIISLEK